jgi:hypothetical protein
MCAAYLMKPKELIVLPDSVYHSYLGRYYFGQTQMIIFGGSYYGWGGLINPVHSQVNLFLNAYTISNFTDHAVTAEGWLSSELPGAASVSGNYASGNQAMIPVTQPQVSIRNANMVLETPIGGTYTFVRQVEPLQTLTKELPGGMIYIPWKSCLVSVRPGSTLLVKV